MREYYSFDIFDTCLVRTCGDPKKVFNILAERVLGDDPAIQVLRNDFALERQQGESRARKTLIREGKEDTSFKEIYDFCDFSFATKIPKENISHLELEIEREVLVPVFTVLQKIKKIREDGKHILFISDMYLPHEFLKQVLIESGLYEDDDILYVSNDVMKGKYTGNLFKHIHNELNIPYNKWEHTGDNIYADVYIPQKLGIKAKLIEHQYSRYEKTMYSRDYDCSRLDVQTLASISKAIRISKEESCYVNFASNFIAPIFVPFVYKVMSEAQERHIDKLFFVARDGWIFYNIAQQFSSLFPNIQLKYLYASRKSLYLPGVEKIDIDEIAKMMGPTFDKNICDLDDIMDMLQIDSYDTNPFNTPNKSIREKTKLLLENKEFIAFVEKNRTEQRKATFLYFKQEGLTEGNNAIVDLTGSRLCHEMLNNILKSHGCSPVYAFYFEVDTHRIKGNNYSALFYRDRFIDNSQNCMIEPHFVIENYFAITDHNRTARYEITDGYSSPVYEKEPGNLKYKRMVMNTNIDVCRQFATHYAKLLKNANHSAMCNNAVAIYSYFFRVPDPRFFIAIEGLTITLSGKKSYHILKKNNFIKALLDKDNLWYNANLIYNSPFPNLTLWIIEREYKMSFPNKYERPYLYLLARSVGRFVKKIISKK